jgi:hypothetical protein
MLRPTQPSSVPHPTQSRHENGIDRIVPSHDDAEISRAVSHSRRRIGHSDPARGQPNVMNAADLSLPQRIVSGHYADDSMCRVDLYSRLRRASDGEMSRRAEQGTDLNDRTIHLNAVEDTTRGWNGNGREYANDAEYDGDLHERERGAHVSFR